MKSSNRIDSWRMERLWAKAIIAAVLVVVCGRLAEAASIERTRYAGQQLDSNGKLIDNAPKWVYEYVDSPVTLGYYQFIVLDIDNRICQYPGP
ncbi:MAG: hypothetical protein IKO01_01455 [Kiritimatiellae bacterium]|nr:hypothetical protein [Kiritimatiellia bacterium]